MLTNGRWSLLVVLSLLMLGCGGSNDPNENVENQSGVILTVISITDDSQGIDGSDEDDITVITPAGVEEVGLFFTGGNQSQSDNITIEVAKVTKVPFDGTEESATYTAVEMESFIKFINNTLSVVPFDLNQHVQGSDYGYDFAVREIGEGGESEIVWRFSDMLDWCINLREAQFAESFDDPDQSYNEPTELESAESWRISDDDRYSSCPLITANFRIVDTWLGRPSQILIEELQAFIDSAPEGDERSFVELYEQALTTIEVHDGLKDKDEDGYRNADYELVVTININEFIDSQEYTFPIRIQEVEFSEIDTD